MFSLKTISYFFRRYDRKIFLLESKSLVRDLSPNPIYYLMFNLLLMKGNNKTFYRQLREVSSEERKMNISIKISQNISEDIIQVIESSRVNFSADEVLIGFVVVSVVIILGVNSSIIK